jgi:hypothetical protein
MNQYLNLVASKPSPVTLEAIDLSNSSDTDVPLFPQALDDADQAVIPNIEEVYGSDDDQPPTKKIQKLD